MRSREIEKSPQLLEQEIASLTEEVLTLKLDHRAELDRIAIELESLKRFIRRHHRDFDRKMPDIAAEVRGDFSPE